MPTHGDTYYCDGSLIGRAPDCGSGGLSSNLTVTPFERKSANEYMGFEDVDGAEHPGLGAVDPRGRCRGFVYLVEEAMRFLNPLYLIPWSWGVFKRYWYEAYIDGYYRPEFRKKNNLRSFRQ